MMHFQQIYSMAAKTSHTNDNQKHNYLNKMPSNVKCHVEDCLIVNLRILVNPKIIRLFVFTSKICTFHSNYTKYPISSITVFHHI